MSHQVYLRCVTHQPTIDSYDAVGNRLSELPQIREDLANREKLVAAYNLGDHMGSFFMDRGRNIQLNFMTEHPNCELQIWDEYGEQYPVTAITEEKEDVLLTDEGARIRVIKHPEGAWKPATIVVEDRYSLTRIVEMPVSDREYKDFIRLLQRNQHN